MIQIILYVALAGVAVFFYALTRPKQTTNNTDAALQQRVESLLQKMAQEQAEIVKSVHHQLSDLQMRMEKLEEKVQQQDVALKQLKKDELVQKDAISPTHSTGFSQSFINFDNVSSFSPKHMQVVYLLQEGKDKRDIARQTGVGIGEIELLQRLLQHNQGDVL